MGKIGLIVAAAGIVLSGVMLLKMKKDNDGSVPKILFVGIGAVIIGGALTMFGV